MDHRFLRIILSFTKRNYSCRYYSRNVSRRRAGGMLSTSEDLPLPDRVDNFKSEPIINQNNSSLNRVYFKLNSNLTTLPYEILEKSSSHFKKTLSICGSRKTRERKGKIILDGVHLINEAFKAQLKVKYLYFCFFKDLNRTNFQISQEEIDLQLFKISPATMQLLTSTSRVIGVFERPSYEDIKGLREPVLPVTILCDNIRDPGNLGSIIRHAAATGCQNVLLMKGCVDPWEAKVLKVGYGGHFRIRITNNIDWGNISDHINKESKIFIADNSSDIEHWEDTPEMISYDNSPMEIEEGDFSETTEEHFSEATEEHFAETTEENFSETTEEDFSETTEEYSMDENSEVLQQNKCNELDKFEDVDLPCYLYSSINYPKDNIVLYVGGETYGVDSRIVQLAGGCGGKKVKIPLENSMDSLNSSFALAIILYEIKRQLVKL